MATSVSSPSPTASTSTAAADSARDLAKQIRSHEVAIAELNHLPSSRVHEQERERRGSRNWNWKFHHLSERVVSSERLITFFMYGVAVYQKNSNIFFRTTVQKATTFEQRQLDAAKAKLDKLNSP